MKSCFIMTIREKEKLKKSLQFVYVYNFFFTIIVPCILQFFMLLKLLLLCDSINSYTKNFQAFFIHNLCLFFVCVFMCRLHYVIIISYYFVAHFYDHTVFSSVQRNTFFVNLFCFHFLLFKYFFDHIFCVSVAILRFYQSNA